VIGLIGAADTARTAVLATVEGTAGNTGPSSSRPVIAPTWRKQRARPAAATSSQVG
jgi:hypothetical protein